MHSGAYNEWISLYNDQIQTIWVKEKSELRKVSMIYCAFEKELNRLKNILNNELSSVKSEFKKRERLEKRNKFKGLAQSEKFDLGAIGASVNKENHSSDLPQGEFDSNEMKSEEFFAESTKTAKFVKKASPLGQAIKIVNDSSPVLHKTSFNFKRKNCLSPNKTTNMETSSGSSTPKLHNDSNIVECSIIDDTPDVERERKIKRSKLRLKKSKKSTTSKQSNTLTQLFLKPKPLNKEMDSTLPSMTVTEMINLINDSDSSESAVESDETVDLELPSQTEADLEPAQNERNPVKKKSDFVYQEVVRGKARKELAGWACRECEDYYEGLNLPPEELQKKKNQCSKHRHRFKPREETYSGFWDLTFGPSPKTQEEESLVFNYKKT